MGQQEPTVAQIAEQAGVDQETFESYWQVYHSAYPKQIEQDTLLDITPFSERFFAHTTLRANCADNALGWWRIRPINTN